MIVISHVVALSNNNVIGVNNDLPWSLKKDLAHFKEYTTNKIILMGRKTFESIGRPLPNRLNFVVSKTIKDIEGAHVFTSTEEALSNAKNLCVENGYKEIVIIGGGYLFRETLDIVDRAYILHDGTVLMEGAPSEIVSHQEVRRFYLGDRFKL